MIRFVLHPGYMMSKTDDQTHYIQSVDIMKLYDVKPNECIIHDQFSATRASIKTIEFNTNSKLIHLYPLYDGNYEEKRRELIENNSTRRNR